MSLFPHYLAFFNELAGGPDGGWRYLADSNTDWGQALKDLAAYEREHGIERVRLSMFTFIDPAVYGVRYEPLTPMLGNTPAVFPSRFNPPPGDSVISATTLDGIPLADPEMFNWFRQRTPDARIGHVMFLYRVKPGQTRTWLAECTTPVAPLEPTEIFEGLGRSDLRLAYFDCATSWLYPAGAGWYIVSRDMTSEAKRFTATNFRFAYEQKKSGFAPPFAVYEGETSIAVTSGLTRTGIVAPSEWPADQAGSDGKKLSAPLLLEGGPTWLGYRMSNAQIRVGQTVELQTFWQVERPPAQPLSLMAHVIANDGHTISVGDGLGVPIENWQVNDILVQRHMLKIPADIVPGSYWVQIGAYALADLRRFNVLWEGQPVGNRILLTRLEVTR